MEFQGVLAEQTAEGIGRELGLRGTDELWFGQWRTWAFTKVTPGVAYGFTIYVPPGTSLQEVERRWRDKEAATLGTERPKGTYEQTSDGTGVESESAGEGVPDVRVHG